MPKVKDLSKTPIKDIKEPLPIPEPEKFESPESSNILGASYQRDGYGTNGKLTIFFHKDSIIKSVYQYRMTYALWVGFRDANSKGQYFAANIRHLPSTKLAEGEWPSL